MPRAVEVLACAAMSVAALCGCTSRSDDFVIARRGAAADCTVVVPENASPAVRFAAGEFREYVKRMTGVELPLKTAAELPTGKAVVIGEGFDIAALGDEGFRIVARGDRLCVLGSGPRGALYGVYELLERFGGCGWFSPDCEVVPEIDAFIVPGGFDVTQKPAFSSRTTSWGVVRKNLQFAARLRINGVTDPDIPAERGGTALRFCKGLGIGHTFQHLMPSEVWFKSHPEYFCEVDGRRRSGREIQPCLTNPDVLRIVVSNVLERLAADPEANVVGVSQNDNRMYCRCEKCRAVDDEEGGPTGSLIRFVNAVAAEVEKVRPDVLVETLVFQYSRKPPKLARPRRNVMPCLCAIEIGHSVPFDDGVPYKVRFRVKVVRDGGKGAAFRATLAEKGAKPVAITNLGEAQTLGRGGEAVERRVDEVGDGYEWYEFRPTALNDRMVFEFGSGPWERGGGIGATKEVRLDVVEISRCD